MKTINIITITLISLFFMNCKNEAKPEVKTFEIEAETIKELDPHAIYAKAEFTIDGMTCAIGCAASIQKKIAKMEGVKSVTVNFDRKLAMVEYNEAKVTPTSLEATVTKVADIYKVSDMKTVDTFSIIKACEKDCCVGKTDVEKANCKQTCCSDTASSNKKACEPGCKKACCTEKKEA